jgi:predicted neutral ceramidase superfamily lipid hydrolase
MNKRKTHIVVYVNTLTHKMGMVGYNYTEGEAKLVAKEFKQEHLRVHVMQQNREFDDDIEAEAALMRYLTKVKLRQIAESVPVH